MSCIYCVAIVINRFINESKTLVSLLFVLHFALAAADSDRSCNSGIRASRSSKNMTGETRLEEAKRFEEQTKAEFEANKKAISKLGQVVEESNRQSRERDAVLLQIQQTLGRLCREKGLPEDASAAFRTPPNREGPSSVSRDQISGSNTRLGGDTNINLTTFLHPVVARTSLTSQIRSGKIEFPTFDGSTSVRGWIFQAEQFFAVNQSAPELMSQIASMHLRGEALQWLEFYMTGMEEWPN